MIHGSLADPEEAIQLHDGRVFTSFHIAEMANWYYGQRPDMPPPMSDLEKRVATLEARLAGLSATYPYVITYADRTAGSAIPWYEIRAAC